jgi:nucleoside-diphosphate kinase
MSIQKTLSIIKPDATSRNLTGSINARFEQAGLRIIAQKRLYITRSQAEKFYEVHREKAFYDSLCEYMSSGPVVAQVLCGEDAVAKNREIMGATNPANAEVGTIRRDFGQSIEHNAVHGSDTLENAEIEIRFFFSQLEIIE